MPNSPRRAGHCRYRSKAPECTLHFTLLHRDAQGSASAGLSFSVPPLNCKRYPSLLIQRLCLRKQGPLLPLHRLTTRETKLAPRTRTTHAAVTKVGRLAPRGDHAGSQCSPRSALLRFLETKRGASAWCVGASAGTLSLLRYQQTSLRRTKLHSLKLLYANQSGLQCIVPTTCLFSAPTSRAKACCASPREDAFIGIP